jgi:hypothetical protein
MPSSIDLRVIISVYGVRNVLPYGWAMAGRRLAYGAVKKVNGGRLTQHTHKSVQMSREFGRVVLHEKLPGVRDDHRLRTGNRRL